MARVPNPIRVVILWIGLGLARLGLIERQRARRTTNLAWPRILTGVARMSKNAVDVAMVGLAVGPAAIAGVGFANPFWGLGFALGGGVAGGTIALVSQNYGAGTHDELGQAVRTSVLLTVLITLPVAVAFQMIPTTLIGLVSNDPQAVALGATYLEIVAFGVPLAGLNLIGSRTLVGADDAWTPMLVRAGGAIINMGINAVLIFGLGLGVVGAAIGTVLANVIVTSTFALGLVTGRVPGIGEFPVTINALGTYADPGTIRQLAEIGAPLTGTKVARKSGEFPLLAIVDIFGTTVVAAFVIALRVRELMNTPGWGFGLASSSLVGQELGIGNEGSAETYSREIIRFAVLVYVVFAGVVFVFARPIALAFLGDPTDPALPLTVTLIYAACFGVVFRGLSRSATGPLRASGDTHWPFYGQTLGMYAVAIPLAYIGAVTPLGITGLVLAIIGEMVVPAVTNYYRFSTGKWKAISRGYRPDAGPTGD